MEENALNLQSVWDTISACTFFIGCFLVQCVCYCEQIIDFSSEVKKE